jgi:hypothetical protein
MIYSNPAVAERLIWLGLFLFWHYSLRIDTLFTLEIELCIEKTDHSAHN